MSSQDTSVRQRKPGKQATKETSDQKQSEPSKQVGQYASPSIGAKLFLGFLVFVFVAGYGVFLFPDAAVDIVSSWLGVDQSRSGWLPGSSPNTYVGFEADVPKRDAVVAAFKHAWGAYEKDAMGADEYHPLSHNGSYLVAAGGIGYTVVDSLDTMLLMGLDDEYQRARKWVEDTVDFDRDGNFNTFETTIRVLGGLLSAYHLSGGDKLYLEKAVDLADRILPAFVGAGLPLSNVNLAKRKGVPNIDDQGLVSTAEAATLQLEFRYLSVLTDDDVYWRTAEKVMALIRANKMDPALVPIFMNPEDGRFVTGPVRLGSRGDSYYEYLLKQYLQTNATEDVYRDMYGDAVSAIHNHLVQRSPSSGLLYTAELIPERTRDNQIAWRLTPKQDFLVCFFAGTLMLGATRAHSVSANVTIPPLKEQLTADGVRDWALGVELLETCLATHQTQTGLAPEIAHFRIPSDNMEKMGSVPRDWYIKGARPGAPAPYDARYMLRPETVESLLYAFRLTGDQRWRDAGWNIFQAIEKHCKIPSGGYATIFNVDALPVEHEDKMETFFMSETLKYLYLLFSDDKVVPLSEYVFNTEAHPLPIFKPTIRTGFI